MNEKELTCLVSEEISNRFVEAIKNDNVAELRTLLEEGITIDSQIDYKFRNRRALLWGAKPIHYAVLYGSLQCAKLMFVGERANGACLGVQGGRINTRSPQAKPKTGAIL